MRTYLSSGKQWPAVSVIDVGRFEVSVSTIFERGQVAVFSKAEPLKALKEFYGTEVDSITRAIAFAKRCEARAKVNEQVKRHADEALAAKAVLS